jgi:hypothetical protein
MVPMNLEHIETKGGPAFQEGFYTNQAAVQNSVIATAPSSSHDDRRVNTNGMKDKVTAIRQRAHLASLPGNRFRAQPL